jgi:hypothetical protein
MTTRSASRRLPSICIDENLSPEVANQFRSAGFRVIEVAKHPGLRGRDERDFLGDLLRENAVFVTGDAEFVRELVNRPRRHPGIVFVEQSFSAEDKASYCLTVAYGIIGRCDESPHAFAGRIVYAGDDGIRVIYRGKDTLAYSWPALKHLSEAKPVERVRKPRHRKRGARTV